MPTYEYKCDACGKTFEKFQSMSSAPAKKCPNCGKNKVRRLIGTGAGLIFKGSGFYITDYRDSKYQEKAKADSGGSSGGDASGGSSGSDSKSDSPNKSDGNKSDSKPKADTKAESKPVAKTESKPAKSDKPAKPSKS